MLKSKWKIKIKAIFIFAIMLGMLFTSLNSLNYSNRLVQGNPIGVDKNLIVKEDLFDGKIPRTSEYQEFDGNGQQLNITVHESLVNSSTIELTNIDIVNNFSEPFPQYQGFNTSLINISLNAIYAPNYTYIVEDDTFEASTDLAGTYVTSFTVDASCFVVNASFDLFTESGTPTANVYLFNSTWAGSSSQPNTASAQVIGSFSSPSNGWNTVSLTKTLLNTTLTDNNTWFIGLHETTGLAVLRWRYVTDATNGDNSYAYRIGVGPLANDYVCTVGLTPLNQNALPSEIGLRINDTLVSDVSAGSGIWSSTEQFNSNNDELEFALTSDWWDVSCNITNVQINYTKSDIKANSVFNIENSGNDVNWTVNIPGGLNYFDSRITNYNTINFTIPETWQDSTIKVYNDTTEMTNLVKRLLGNGYREVQVLNAGNGSNWYLTANSTNLLTSVTTYVNGNPLIQVNFTDVIRFNATFNEVVSDGNLNLSIFSPTSPRYLNYSNILDISTQGPSIEFNISDWDISANATDYGVFKAQISWNNDTAAGFLESFFTIVANTDFKLDSPQSGIDRFDNELFDIIVFFNDTGPDLGDIGITGTTITENSTLLGAAVPTGTDGYYSLECNVSLFSYGWVYIEISANKPFYNNQSLIFSFHHRINTTITPSNSYNFGDVIRGDTVSYNFTYSDVLSNPILGATIQEVSLPSGFVSNNFEIGGEPGNYTIELDTSNVQASASAYACIFNITATGNQTQVISLILTVKQAQTSLTINSYIGALNRKDGFDQQIEFFFNDTDNDKGVLGLTLGDISVTDNQTGSTRPINSLISLGAGNYSLNISISNLDSGWIQFGVNVSRDPDYNWSIDYFSFYLRGNLTYTSIKSIEDVDQGQGSQGILTPTALNYSIYVGLNININFTILDTDFGNNTVTGGANSYTVNYYQISNPTNQGTLLNALAFDVYTKSFKGIISTSNIATLGTYAINLSIIKTNYEVSSVTFNLTIKSKILINVSAVEPPSHINAGSSFNLTIKVEYYNGTSWVAFNGVSVTLTENTNGKNSTTTSTLITNINGTVTFTEITVGTEVTTIILYAEVNSAYNHTGLTRVISGINVIPPPSIWEELLPYLIIGGIILLTVVGAVSVYRGVVVPKKREKQRALTEVKTIFDDAINLEHILVLYKATGTCIFFKSYGSEEIDPELISGFLTAVSSFGKEMVAQEALNEISYGDKMLLLADGEYVRVALVLGKRASLILRTHLKQFIDRFEQVYNEILPKWRGQLAYFRNAGEIVDDILNTSIILPHQISYDFSNVKDLKNPHSKDVLKIAHNCCEETERQFFFIATLLQEASQNTNKDTAEIFMGIKELRDKKILMPIEISAIETVPISQQEINLINQKVAQLSNLSPEEKQKLVNDLAQLGPAEREAYLSSLSERTEIVSAPIRTTIGTVEVGDKKTAKKEMKNLVKKAKSFKSEGEYSESIDAMRSAAMLASNWDFPNEFMRMQEQIRMLQIEDLKIKKKETEKAAKVAVKQKIYGEAAVKYKAASKIASEIFKLGDPSMTSEVKRLTNKAREYEKLS